MTIDDKARSTRTNYCRYLAALANFYHQLPTELSLDQVEEYLYAKLNTQPNPSLNFFKFTIYGLRYACKVMGKDEFRLQLPAIRRERKLPLVLSKSEMTAMMNSPHNLRHRVLIAVLYGCGLRLGEAQNLRCDDVDLERALLLVRKTKVRKDRYMPMGVTLREILTRYMNNMQKNEWLFPGQRWKSNGRFFAEFEKPYGKRSVQWAVKRAARLAGIRKPVNVHSLRHTFATHLLEDGVNILTIKELLGHASIKNTMMYLHVAQVDNRQRRSPLDSLEGVEVIRKIQGELPF